MPRQLAYAYNQLLADHMFITSFVGKRYSAIQPSGSTIVITIIISASLS